VDLIYIILFKPDVVIWGGLLGASRLSGNFELGKLAAEYLLELEPDDLSTYVLLSNIYAASGRGNEVALCFPKENTLVSIEI